MKFLKREVHGFTVGAWILAALWIGVIFWTIGWVNFLFHFGFRFGIVGLVFFIPWAWSFDWNGWINRDGKR